MIKRIYIDNYKCFNNFALELGPVELLLGDNGVGKTSIFEAIGTLQDFIAGRLATDNAFIGSNLTRWLQSNRQTFEIDLLVEGHELTYRLVTEVNPEIQKSKVLEEKLFDKRGAYLENHEGALRLSNDRLQGGTEFKTTWSMSAMSIVADRPDNKVIQAFKQSIARILILKLIPSTMGALSSEESDRLLRNGANFASWWRAQIQEHPELLSAGVADLRRFMPTLRSPALRRESQTARKLVFVFPPPSYQEQVGLTGAQRSKEDIEFSFEELSDGQRVLTMLYSLINGLQYQGYSLFLDEPDNFVALPEVQPILERLQDASGSEIEQTCLISHHPELIDFLGHNHSKWLYRPDGGSTRERPAPAIDESKSYRLSDEVARGWVG